MLYNVKEDTLEIDGMSIDYVAFGSGGDVMVIIPGLSLKRVKGTGFTLAVMYRQFTKKFRVYIFDRRKVIPENYTAEDIGDEIAAAMNAIGLKNACVMGVSQGGMAAQYLAIKHPELVKKLVLGVTLSRNNDIVRGAVDEWVSLAEKGDIDGLVISTMKYNYPPERFEKFKLIMPALVKAGRPKDPQTFVRMTKACMTCDTYDRLEEIKCPVLVIGDKQDRIVSPEASKEIAEKLGCELYMTEAYGHGAYEQPEFNDKVAEFFGVEK
ncbi:alpha/beta fold hydrolase [Ruminococcus albus]|uniref:Pimeloyl-ACP methyl ester carboxylesterase n=1 Tax=Ruminococcus albus TaxID=1264 RepID=A0A1I1P8J4_RUMAL|nr:alpha/beta hydrolase [Ruminococcus albus]SFD06129.1 Pimeloyl-ACP methyl ester carboxylesterase [Ruminococcus albus]